jgi:hypothetical protein
MKLSTDTLSVFKNFSTINEGIFVKRGNVIETISKQKNILARAELKDTFDDEFGIHDLNNFLGVLSMQRADTPELEFSEKNITILGLSGRSKTNYRKASKETILVPPDKKVNMENAEVKFTVTPDDLDWITRAASVLGSPNIAFFSDGESVSIETFDAKDDSAHVNSTKLNVNGTGAKYRMVFATDNLKLIPGSYDITISSKGIGHFKNATVNVEYWITTETGSKYEG